MVHILLLTQFTANVRTKVWADFDCVYDCCMHICRMFEDSLKRQNPFLPEITYDITELYDFVDNLQDLSCLISKDDSEIYVGYDKGWLKMKLFFVLRKEVNEIEDF